MNIFKSVVNRYSYYKRILRSYIFCFRYLPYEQAKRMPFFLDSPIDVLELAKGDIVLRGEVTPKMIWIGGGIDLGQKKQFILEVNEGGKLIFEGSAFIANGCAIRVQKNSQMTIGNKTGFNSNCFLSTASEITLGHDVMFGWDNEVVDTDGHNVFVNGVPVEKSKPVHIGNHVWVTSHVRISKGVTIADDCIIAKGAVVVKNHETPHTLIGGVPANDIKTGVDWKK